MNKEISNQLEIEKLKNKVKELEYVEKYYINKVKEQYESINELSSSCLERGIRINKALEILEQIDRNKEENKIYEILKEEKKDIDWEEDSYYI